MLDLSLTFHDFLDFHFKCDDFTDVALIWIIEVTLDTMNGEISVRHGSYIVVLQEDHLISVLNDGA